MLLHANRIYIVLKREGKVHYSLVFPLPPFQSNSLCILKSRNLLYQEKRCKSVLVVRVVEVCGLYPQGPPPHSDSRRGSAILHCERESPRSISCSQNRTIVLLSLRRLEGHIRNKRIRVKGNKQRLVKRKICLPINIENLFIGMNTMFQPLTSLS